MMDMPSVAVLMPVVKRDRAQAAEERWTKQGYRVFFYQDPGTEPFGVRASTRSFIAPYRGVYHAVNDLARIAMMAEMDVCVYAGDDMDPDPNHTAQEIARQYLERFPTGWGVMQPCGDPQGQDASGRSAAARICGSAWFGRNWIQHAYRGHGPMWGDYFHFYSDQELAVVAEQLRILWWRPDLTQFHHHWSFGHTPKELYHDRAQNHWVKDQALFRKRQAEEFPGFQWKPKEEPSC